MFLLRNFCQTNTPCRHQSLNYCNGNILFLWQKKIQVQSLTFFSKYLSVTLLQLFTTSRIITAATSVVPFNFQGQLWGGFPSTKHFSQSFNIAILVFFKVVLLCNKVLHAQIIFFIVVYWKVGDIPWKWNTTVNIYLLL